MSIKQNKGRSKKMKQNVSSKKNLNVIRLLFIIVAIAFSIIFTRFYISLLKTNMLPAKYVTIATIIEIVFIFLIVIGLVKKHKTLKLNIICLIIAVILSFGILFANTYIDATINFIRKAFAGANAAEIEEYYVIVSNDSRYTKINDLTGKEIFSIKLEDDIKHKIQQKELVVVVEGDSLVDMGQSLLDKKIEAAAISSAQYDILNEEIEDFKNKTKIIDTETHEIQSQESIEDADSDYKIGNGVFNIYVSGIDVYGKISTVSRTDANMVVTVNMNTHEILLTSIPRDYYVTLHSKKAKDKLTHSGIYGITETVTTVEDFLGIDINYYLRVNFSTVENLIDTIGGVDVYSDYTFTSYAHPPATYSYQKGYNHLNGKYALVFARERNAFKDGDNQRIKDQQHVIEAIINKISSSTTLLTKYSSILESLSGSFNTNISSDDITKLVKWQLDKMPKWDIKSISLTGSGASRTTYSMGSQELYVTIPSQKSIDEARTKIQELMNKR